MQDKSTMLAPALPTGFEHNGQYPFPTAVIDHFHELTHVQLMAILVISVGEVPWIKGFTIPHIFEALERAATPEEVAQALADLLASKKIATFRDASSDEERLIINYAGRDIATYYPRPEKITPTLRPKPPLSENDRLRRRFDWHKAKHRRKVLERDGHACRHCGATDDLTLDHIKPLSQGGSNDIDNLQTLCRPCNSKKGNR